MSLCNGKKTLKNASDFSVVEIKYIGLHLSAYATQSFCKPTLKQLNHNKHSYNVNIKRLKSVIIILNRDDDREVE